MDRNQNPNLEILMLAVDQLGELADEMGFLGGCATGLLITDKAAPPIRVTKDVDAIVQVYSRGEYYRLAEKLRDKGFNEDTSDGAPLCRWAAEGVTLDVMPTNKKLWGSVIAGMSQLFRLHKVSNCPMEKRSNWSHRSISSLQSWKLFMDGVKATIC